MKFNLKSSILSHFKKCNILNSWIVRNSYIISSGTVFIYLSIYLLNYLLRRVYIFFLKFLTPYLSPTNIFPLQQTLDMQTYIPMPVILLLIKIYFNCSENY